MIKLNNVSYHYENNVYALRDINIEIKEGEAVALIGSNGCGKSSLLKLLNGLIFPTEGDFYYKDQVITEKKLNDIKFSKAFHKSIGFLFQNSDSQLFCTSVYEEIAFGPNQMNLSEEEKEKRVKDVMELLNIESLKDRIPYYLSGGEKKKVALAAMLAVNPEIIILDEPLNGLDPKTKKFIRELLLNLNRAGKTIICATHDFQYIDDIFTRAIGFSEDHRIFIDAEYDKVIGNKKLLQENNII